MPKPVTEHSTTFKPSKGKSTPRDSGLLEPVGGGHVRRVEFRDVGARTETTVVRDAPAKSDDSLDDIHWEIDNLSRLRKGAAPRARRPRETPRTKRVFETEKGAVTSSQMETTRGERRVLYTSRRKRTAEEETRFHSGLVDRIIAEKYQGGPQWAESGEAEPKRSFFGRKKAAEPKAADPEFQPQCMAVTRDGVQCRNSAKGGSDYCGSHQSYTPRAVEDILDTLPARGDDTKPGEGDKSGTGQCAAYTKEGMQCRRNSRKSSKYCSTHKGYRPPSKDHLTKRMDTKPRHAGAADTEPNVR